MLPIGLHENISHDVYHADPSERPSLSSHLAGILLARSPAHAKLSHPRFGGAFPDKPSDEMNVGSIIHGLLLGGGADIVEIDADNYRTKAAQEARDLVRVLQEAIALTVEYQETLKPTTRK